MIIASDNVDSPAFDKRGRKASNRTSASGSDLAGVSLCCDTSISASVAAGGIPAESGVSQRTDNQNDSVGIVARRRVFDLHDVSDSPEKIADRAFSCGRYSDLCERGRANNVALAARSALAAGQLGLVRAAYLTVYPDSRLLCLQLPTFGASEPPVAGRGKVNGMSDESRRRLMMLLHSLKRSAANPAFVTLTFPDSRIPSPAVAKVMLQTLFKRWRRRSPQLCAIWRLEAHPARSDDLGMPVAHFHLLVWGAWIDRFQLSLDWARVVDAPEFEQHLAAGTKVESIRSFRGVCSYAAKYISKASLVSLGDDAGRVWGCFNKEALSVGESFTVKLDAGQCVRVVRHVKRLLFSRGVETEWLPRAIYCECPLDILRVLEESP